MSKKSGNLKRKLRSIPPIFLYMIGFFCGGGFIGAFIAWLIVKYIINAPDAQEEEELDRPLRKTDEEVGEIWEAVEQSGAQAETLSRFETEDKAANADPTVADIIREGQDALRRIRRANDRIPDPQLTAQISSIENSCRQIMKLLKQRPSLLPKLRTFLRYYLPTTLKLLEARARLETEAATPKAREVRERISEALGKIDTAFKEQLAAVDESSYTDLENEMDTIEDMMKSDGLLRDEEHEDFMSQALGGH